MNGATKVVVTHHDIDPTAWSGSRVLDRPLAEWVRRHVATTDLVVIGSESVVDELAGEDLVDEYRLLMFPTAVGTGRRLVTDIHQLGLVSVEKVGPAALLGFTTRDV